MKHRRNAGYRVTHLLLLAASLSFSFCASEASAPQLVRAELAPSGKLRVGLFNNNPVYVTHDDGSDQLEGVAPDLGRELAKRVGVGFEPVRYPNILGLLAGAKAGDWDVAFVGVDPTRAIDFVYAATYMDEEYTYLVGAGSPIHGIADADRQGHRIAVAQGGVGDLFLTPRLKEAELLRVPEITSGTLQLLSTGTVQAVVWGRPALARLAPNLPGSRVLDEAFYVTPLGVAVLKGRPAGTAYVTRFIEDAKASGLIGAIREAHSTTSTR